MDWTQLLQLSLHFDQHLGGLIAQYGTSVYVMLFAIVFCEIAFLPLFFLPGDPLLFICGAFCARGAIDIRVLIPLLFVATVAGSVANYWIARGIGQRVLAGEHRWLNRNALQKTHAFYEQRGGLTFLLSPFIAVIRTLAPFVGGLSAMTFARFLWFVTLGAALWVGVLVVGGYFFGNVPLIRDHMSSIVLLGVALGVGALVISSVWRLVKGRRTLRQDR